MKILYDKTGEIYYAVPDRDWFLFGHSTNVPLSIFGVDEVDPDNKAVCFDLYRMQGRRDVNGLAKYYIQDNELHVRDGWAEYMEEL